MHAIRTYRGILSGWQIIAVRNTPEDARRFRDLLRRIRPHQIHHTTAGGI
jgi:hypothetical protein